MLTDTLTTWSPWTEAQRRFAVGHLLASAVYAQDLGVCPWDFAIELEHLIAAGLTANDLRWLCAKGYLEHDIESRRSRFRKHGTSCSTPLLEFAKGSRFILTAKGTEFALHVCKPTDNTECDATQRSIRDVPRWDHATRMLWFGADIVKQFKLPAPNQECILSVLQEVGWPTCIDDPLPPTPGVDSKRRLHDTIFRLNRGHRRRVIRFAGSGNGLAIHWEYAPTGVAADNRATTDRV